MAQCRHCCRSYSEGGDGYDGMCPRCADRSECKTCEGIGSITTKGAETVIKGVRCSVSSEVKCVICNGQGHFDNPAEAGQGSRQANSKLRRDEMNAKDILATLAAVIGAVSISEGVAMLPDGKALSLTPVDEDSVPGDEAVIGSDEWYIRQARDQYGSEGSTEIDDGAVISRGDDPGAYVAAWVWVGCEYCEECGAALGDDEDAACPTCTAKSDEPECGKCVTCGAQCVSGGEGSVLCPVCDKTCSLCSESIERGELTSVLSDGDEVHTRCSDRYSQGDDEVEVPNGR